MGVPKRSTNFSDGGGGGAGPPGPTGVVAAQGELVDYDAPTRTITVFNPSTAQVAGLGDELATKEDAGVAAELVAAPELDVGIGYRTPGLDDWLTSLRAPTGIRYVVVVGDSFGVFGSDSYPWLVESHLIGLTNIKGSPLGWLYPSGGGLIADWTTNGGSDNTSTTSGYGSTLTAGQKATIAGTCDGITLFYRTAPGAGSIIVRDGVGGTVLDAIDTDAAAGMASWTSGALALASRTIEIEASGGTVVVDGSYQTDGNRTDGIRVISASRSGEHSKGVVDNPVRAIDLIEHLDSLGQLALVITATGTNDNPTVGWQGQLIDAVQAAAPTVPVVSWIPPINAGNPPSEHAAMRADVLTRGVPLIDGTTLGRIDGGDNVHPTLAGQAMIARQIATVLSGDPIGAQGRLAEGRFLPLSGGALTGNLSTTGDLSTAGSIVAAGNLRGSGGLTVGPSGSSVVAAAPASGRLALSTSAFGIALGINDAQVEAFRWKLQEPSADPEVDPAAPAANNAVVYLRDDGSGKSQMCVRFATGAVQVIATEP